MDDEMIEDADRMDRIARAFVAALELPDETTTAWVLGMIMGATLYRSLRRHPDLSDERHVDVLTRTLHALGRSDGVSFVLPGKPPRLS